MKGVFLCNSLSDIIQKKKQRKNYSALPLNIIYKEITDMKEDMGVVICEEMMTEESKLLSAAKGFAIGITSFSKLPWSIPFGAAFGHVIQKKVNSFAYECKNIQDPQKKINCQIKLVTFMIQTAKTGMSKTNDPKIKQKLSDSIRHYSLALDKLKTKASQSGLSSPVEESIEESAKGGLWKGGVAGIFGPFVLPIFGAVTANKINKLVYHCNDYPKGPERNKCILTVLDKVISIMSVEARNDPKAAKYLVKLNNLKSKMTNH